VDERRTDSSAFLIVQGVLHDPVEAARRQVLLDPAIERSRSCVLIEPQPQFFQLFLRNRIGNDSTGRFGPENGERELPAVKKQSVEWTP